MKKHDTTKIKILRKIGAENQRWRWSKQVICNELKLGDNLMMKIEAQKNLIQLNHELKKKIRFSFECFKIQRKTIVENYI